MVANRMIVSLDNGVKYHHVCSCWRINYTFDCDHFYSYMQAIDNGWVKTRDRKYCPPKEDYVWVCPKCADGNF